MKHSSGHDRRESYSSYQRNSSPEDRYAEQERSSQNRDYSDYSRSNHERSRRGHSYDGNMESRSRDREKRRERERDTDRKRSRKSLSPGRRSPELAATQNSAQDEPHTKKKKDELDPLLTRTGGAYIPPAKLRMMQEQITDKNSLAYQRMSWEALKKSINGLINKVNISNISIIIKELLQENIVRGRGLLSRSVLQAQSASPIFTHVYAALVAIINSKFPRIGELILKRLILNFRKGYRRNDKQLCLTASKFVAHLINQNVAHEVLCLEMLTLLLERPTDDSVEVAIGFLKECGLKLTQVSPRGVNAIFERLRNILHESEIDKRVQYMIEVMFAVRKDGFKDHPVILEGLDLVEEDDQFTHMLPLEDDYNPEDVLNVFKMDPNFMENEEKYKAIKKEILDEGDSDSNTDQDAESSKDEDEDEEEEEGEEDDEGQKVTIHDKTEINLVSFRRTIYLAIQSSLDFEECAHKLLKMEFPESQTKELCNMILDCCAQQRTYEKFFGLLAGRFCMLKKEYMESFEGIFKEQYDTIHRLETNKLRNVAKMFAHLLYTDSLPWSVLECIKLSEETTTSSSRIFVKIFFQELCEYMGLPKLNARLKDDPCNCITPCLLSVQPVALMEPGNYCFHRIRCLFCEINPVVPLLLGSDVTIIISHFLHAAKDTRKKRPEKTRSKVDKSARDRPTSDRSREGRREQSHQEARTEREPRAERHRSHNSRDANWRAPLTRHKADRGSPSEEDSYSRVGNGRDQHVHVGLENKHGDPRKRGERRNSFPENEKQSTRNQDSEKFRRKDRSKSRERNRKHSGYRSDEDRYQNGSERRWEKPNRYSEHSRESQRNQDRRREKSPAKQK
ncbi:pre-mRNA-splicing factor CWC22 homolog [Nannospalax galili]|uniref:pre-mRNA-splicing factor CWC22 homolog n=1 Tax=Nannospalax galili TaxID=1026970 RepID=UPI00111BF902|nr:pre-mRNA-splicing factor CWC22 homolog [Nannospalax galili]